MTLIFHISVSHVRWYPIYRKESYPFRFRLTFARLDKLSDMQSTSKSSALLWTDILGNEIPSGAPLIHKNLGAYHRDSWLLWTAVCLCVRTERLLDAWINLDEDLPVLVQAPESTAYLSVTFFLQSFCTVLQSSTIKTWMSLFITNRYQCVACTDGKI
jgi:hypothetical protein